MSRTTVNWFYIVACSDNDHIIISFIFSNGQILKTFILCPWYFWQWMIEVAIIAAVAGHSKTTITMNRYAHARRDSAVRGIKELDEAYNLWYDLWYAFLSDILWKENPQKRPICDRICDQSALKTDEVIPINEIRARPSTRQTPQKLSNI